MLRKHKCVHTCVRAVVCARACVHVCARAHARVRVRALDPLREFMSACEGGCLYSNI